MFGIDRRLLHEARSHITPDNVHLVETWILGYTLSSPFSASRRTYRRLLCEFVASKNEAGVNSLKSAADSKRRQSA